MEGVPEGRLEDLIRVGLLEPNAEGLRATRPAYEAALKLFHPVLGDYQIKLAPMEIAGCPVQFCTAIAEGKRKNAGTVKSLMGAFPAGGQGWNSGDAAISCIGEIAERLSLCTSGARDPRISTLNISEGDVALGPCLGYSRLQELALAGRYGGQNNLSASGRIRWNSLTERRVSVKHLFQERFGQVPGYGALIGEAVPFGRATLGVASTSGAAVWSDQEGALERALLELVERDAVAQAWYNRLGIKRVDDDLLAGVLEKKLCLFLKKRPRRWLCMRVDTDLPCHVVMAVSHSGGGRMAAFGASADWDLGSAVIGAAFEMLQSENALGLMERSYPQKREARQRRLNLPPALAYARSRSVLDDLDAGQLQPGRPADHDRVFKLAELKTDLEKKGIDIWVFDATHPDLGVPCVKLFSPDLCDWRPRFGKRRLYDGVVARGLRDRPALEEEFAARPVPF